MKSFRKLAFFAILSLKMYLAGIFHELDWTLESGRKNVFTVLSLFLFFVQSTLKLHQFG